MTIEEVMKEIQDGSYKKYNSIIGSTLHRDKHSYCITYEFSNANKYVLLPPDGWKREVEKVDWNTALEHMRDGGEAKLDGITYRFKFTVERFIKNFSGWASTTVSGTMLDSKEWELL